MTAYVAIIPGHGARPQGWDPGAVGTRQTDTGPEPVGEAALVRQIAPLTLRRLQALGIGCGIHDAPSPCPDGHPMEQYRGRVAEGLRSAAARKSTRCVVAHLHLNAGGGSYTAAIVDGRSPGCAMLADSIEGAVSARCPDLRRRGASTWQAGFPRAEGLIETVWREGRVHPTLTAHALVIELAFVDTASHQRALARDLPGLADALADGIAAGLRRLG